MSIAKQVEDIISHTIEENGMELVDVQFVTECGRKVLRIFIDKEGGIALKDCELMSSKLGEVLDKSEILNYPYVLEVSSPGIDRVLKKEKDFLKYIGEKIKVSVFEPIEGQRHFNGILESFQDGRITLDDISGKKVSIEISKIAKASLNPDIDAR